MGKLQDFAIKLKFEQFYQDVYNQKLAQNLNLLQIVGNFYLFCAFFKESVKLFKITISLSFDRGIFEMSKFSGRVLYS